MIEFFKHDSFPINFITVISSGSIILFACQRMPCHNSGPRGCGSYNLFSPHFTVACVWITPLFFQNSWVESWMCRMVFRIICKCELGVSGRSREGIILRWASPSWGNAAEDGSPLPLMVLWEGEFWQVPLPSCSTVTQQASLADMLFPTQPLRLQMSHPQLHLFPLMIFVCHF